ncbi:FprA family A-type flavoprotein [Olsenella massiliensis]|uniref:FprA family A-type flavoprotein n=1 Tax=Olsenella massiliensis TaxID=1622075 RepID=UPI00071D5528|nr:FprA family A-type flavoprotein [Olsenella massiliensis]
MHNVRQICEDTWWVGASDRRLELFENNYPTPEGMAYNNFVIMDEKTCLLDGIDNAVRDQLFENLAHVLGGRPLDYLVVDHMEPDHCAAIPDLVRRYPELKLVASMQGFRIMGQFYPDLDIESRKIVVKEGDTLELGRHTLRFITAPMVHWPEVIMSFDVHTGALFSADAFGEFGALGGNLFADEVKWTRTYAREARRYYANIVGKYGPQTLAVLAKAAKLDLKYIFPLHGHLWRQDFDRILLRYQKWASYTPEYDSVCIFYGSVYGHTANAADILAGKLAERGLKNVRVYDSSKTDVSELVSRAFQYSTLVFASSTYNLDIFDGMDHFVQDLVKHNMRNRTVAIIENGSWSPQAGALLKQRLGRMSNVQILDPMVKIKSSVTEEDVEQLDALADAIVEDLAR